jgi:hypothetical protein
MKWNYIIHVFSCINGRAVTTQGSDVEKVLVPESVSIVSGD